jgi:glucose uptake protein GlcU
MNAITMIRTAVALLAIGALGGVVMAITRLSKNINPPTWLAMLHGFLAAAAATLLLYAALTVGIPLIANVGLAFLLIAALGGVVLNLKYQWERALIPPGLMVGHAVLAVIGFVLVLLVAWNGR